MKNIFRVIAAMSVLSFATACSFQHSGNALAPSTAATSVSQAAASSTTPGLVGTWAAAAQSAATIPAPSSCTNFQWTVTSQTASTLSGTFSAQCAGGLSISGIAFGQLGNLASIPMTATGTASAPGVPTCDFSLSGTGAVQDSANALQVQYTGTSCLGPVHGTETLRKAAPAQVPTPAPAPAPTPTPTPPAPAPSLGSSDAIDLRQATVSNSPADVASWPITTTITRLEMLGCNVGIGLTFPAQATWPDYTPPGWSGTIQYTIWAVVNVNGRWNTSGFIEMWRGRGDTGAPILPLSCGFPVNWAYDGRWGAMSGYQPQVGEQMGFFVTAGDARGFGGVTSVRERSNVVMVNLPADTGVFTW